jgi:hypothetical protein
MQEFLVHAQVGFRDIQECPLGAAYVRFNHVRDRDRLIRTSPIPFGDVHVSFCKHNEGVNWRCFSLNRECWVLLVGPPLDYRFIEDLNVAFLDIGKLLFWEKDEANLGRIIAKVRVSDLEEIPKSIHFTDGDRPDSESWTFSIEILQEEMLGGGPADEDPLPDDGMDPHPLSGNAMQNLPFMPPTPQPQNNEDDAEEGWGHWAMGNGQNNEHAMQLDQHAGLNNLLQAMEAEEIQENQDDQPMQEENSGLTISISSSDGASSDNAAFLLPPAEEASSPWCKIQMNSNWPWAKILLVWA